MDKIKNLLQQVSIIQKKYDDLAEYSGEHYNVFDILGVRTDELSHSSIIANLLNAEGKHGQKDIFLKLFNVLFQEKFKTEEKKSLFSTFKTLKSNAITEKFAGRVNYEAEQGGRIDIVVNDGENNIIIENKVYAGDQHLQIKRYYEFDNKAPIFYLTLYGSDPSNESKGNLEKENNYCCISYELDIKLWLESCIKEMANKPIIRETLNQYLYLVKSITNQSNNSKMSEDLIILMENNISASFEIAKNLENLKSKLFFSFIEKLTKNLEQNDLIVTKSDNLGCKDSCILITKKEWNLFVIQLYFQELPMFKKVLLGIKQHETNASKNIIIKSHYKNRDFGKPLINVNAGWHVLYEYNKLNQYGNINFWQNLLTDSFILNIANDLINFCEIFDKTEVYKN